MIPRNLCKKVFSYLGYEYDASAYRVARLVATNLGYYSFPNDWLAKPIDRSLTTRVGRVLAEKPHQFYLYHALLNLLKRLESSIIVGEELRRDQVLRGIEIDLRYVRDVVAGAGRIFRIGYATARLPSEVLHSVRERFDGVVQLLYPEARERVSKRLRRERLVSWDEEVRQRILGFSVEVALGLRSTPKADLLADLLPRAMARTRLLDYLLVYGAPITRLVDRIATSIDRPSLASILRGLGLELDHSQLETLERLWRETERLLRSIPEAPGIA